MTALVYVQCSRCKERIAAASFSAHIKSCAGPHRCVESETERTNRMLEDAGLDDLLTTYEKARQDRGEDVIGSIKRRLEWERKKGESR